MFKHLVLVLLLVVQLQAVEKKKEKKNPIGFPKEEKQEIEFKFSWGKDAKEPFEIHYNGSKKWPEKDQIKKELQLPLFQWKMPTEEVAPDLDE